MKNKEIRTRFAPSPTGNLHIGGYRTCLYNYLFAKKNKGKCILRIEDTDQNRFVKDATESFIKVLNEMGIEFDEGPYIKNGELKEKGEFGPYTQSKRSELYKKHAQILIEKNAAYYCFATPKELEKMREEQTKAGLPPLYDRRALKLTTEEINEKLKNNVPHVIRLKMPRNKTITFNDCVKGKVSFLSNQIDDQILIKSDGLPTYHLANVVDDHQMKISHVIRGEEWLSSTPKHIVMYEAFGFEPPTFVHLPLILNKDRKKLSKRDSSVAIEDYLKNNYEKKAITNYMALLGWNPGKGNEKEIFTIEELINFFSLENLNKSGSIFDIEKFNWFDQMWKKINYFKALDLEALKLNSSIKIEITKIDHHIFEFSDMEQKKIFEKKKLNLLKKIINPFLENKFKKVDQLRLDRAIMINEEKIVKSPQEINSLIEYFFYPKNCDRNMLLNEKMGVTDMKIAEKSLLLAKKILIDFMNDDTDLEKIKEIFTKKISEEKIKNGTALWPLRVGLTRESFSVGAFESIFVLGKEESIKRLEEMIIKVQNDNVNN